MRGRLGPRDPSWRLLRAKGHQRHQDKRDRKGRKPMHKGRPRDV